MADEMSSIAPRLNDLEKQVHTLQYRMNGLEDSHKDMPQRLTKVEMAVQRLPEIEAQLKDQGDMIKRGFFMTHGILVGAGVCWAVFQAGPQIIKYLGGV